MYGVPALVLRYGSARKIEMKHQACRSLAEVGFEEETRFCGFRMASVFLKAGFLTAGALLPPAWDEGDMLSQTSFLLERICPNPSCDHRLANTSGGRS